MARKPIFECRVYTSGPVGPNNPASYEEGVWELDESGDAWKPKGPKLGTVKVTEKLKASSVEKKKKDFVAKFTVKDVEGQKIRHITVKGDLPSADGLSWIGSDSADAEDDDDHTTKPNITVEGKNPKRWG